MKRLLALLLCLVLALSLIPAAAAEEIEIVEPAEEEEEAPISVIDPEAAAEEPAAPAGEPVTNGSCGENMSWSLTSDGHGLVISGSGLMDDYSWGGAPWYYKRDDITTISVNRGVQSVGKNAFSGLRKVQTVSLPVELEVIADDAFYECTELKAVALPLGLLALGNNSFAYCYKLESVSFPVTLQTIGGYAFTGCSSLQSVEIPSTVTKIEGGAFSGCDQLSSISVVSGSSTYKSINGVLFSADGKTLVCYPAGKSASSYTVPTAVKELGDQCFKGCASLTSIKLPSGLTRIGGDAMQECGLTTVTIPKNVTEIGAGAFRGCNSMTEILVDADNASFKSVGGALLSKDGTLFHSYPCGLSASSYKIPSGVQKIKMFAFYYPNLSKVTIPDSVTELETWAFISWESSDLKEIVFQGSAPGFDGEYSMQGVGAMVYYPAGDASWTGIAGIGDHLTWVAVNKATVTTQPASVGTLADQTVKFTVKATGDDLVYQWQYRTSSSGSWKSTALSGNKTATLSVKATEARNGYQYRCKLTNKLGTVYSKAATLTICVKPTITTQPASKTAAEGKSVKFSVSAEGGALSYQWYYRTSSTGSWTKSSGAGATTATLTVEAKSFRSGYQYRCKVSNAAGYKYSSAATLTVTGKPTVTTQPASKTASAGTTVKFTVKATDATSYQWYYRTSSSGSWQKCSGTGAATATLSVEAKSFRSGYQYRCKVSNEAGYVFTSAATLTVK